MGTKAMIAPGVRLMQRLQLRTKLGLVMVSGVAPLFWIGWQSRVMILENWAVAQGEAQGAAGHASAGVAPARCTA